MDGLRLNVPYLQEISCIMGKQAVKEGKMDAEMKLHVCIKRHGYWNPLGWQMTVFVSKQEISNISHMK